MSPWDRLLDRLDELACAPHELPDDLESEISALLLAAMRDGMADRELDPADSARWLATLLRTLTVLQPQEARADDTLSTLRVIVTRWLHPARLDQEAQPLPAHARPSTIRG
ncbi:hypothetical protein [Aeromicrobium sp. CTD01-1L150]|uniref:hypothetical protein n=1 Tax=Aeromicrobium sp. CTD01-1L150 TaxID=3341830 RepID=UPI0035C23EE5